MHSETNPVSTCHTKQGNGEDNDHYALLKYCHRSMHGHSTLPCIRESALWKITKISGRTLLHLDSHRILRHTR